MMEMDRGKSFPADVSARDFLELAVKLAYGSRENSGKEQDPP